MITRLVADFGPLIARARRHPRKPDTDSWSFRELAFFALNWVRHPVRMGAVMPSSRGLARAMVRGVALRGDEAVLELGAGTGRLTAALLAAGLPPERLVLLEVDPKMAAWLAARFPGVAVIEGCASEAGRLLPEALHGRIGAVVSGLPFRVMPVHRRKEILAQAFAAMPAHGRYVQYSYGHEPPVDAEALGLEPILIDRVWQNLPPARVWCYRRAGADERSEAA